MSDSEKQYKAVRPNAGNFSESDEVDRQWGEADSLYEAKLVRKLDIFSM